MSFLNLRLIALALLILNFLPSCNNSGVNTDEGIMDSTEAYPPISDVDYIDEQRGYDIDTASSTDLNAEQLEIQSNEFRDKLAQTLPKFTITEGRRRNEYYIVEGDLKLDFDELLEYCTRKLVSTDTNYNKKRLTNRLTVRTDLKGNGHVWKPGTVVKYTIMYSSFDNEELYNKTVIAMQRATRTWMDICNIKFEHLSNLDDQTINVGIYPDTAFFVVRQLDVNGDFIAQAFFPKDAKFKRRLLLDNSFFESSYSQVGVLQHELGHIMGFSHEHIWSGDDSCPGEAVIQGAVKNTRLTDYDPYSVMHYPCGKNVNNKALNLTAFDIEGAKKVYPY